MSRAAPPGNDAGRLECNPDRTRRLKRQLRRRKYRESAFPASQHPIFPFVRNGFRHELLERTGRVCLVQRSKSGRQRHFEVVVLQHRKARILPNGEFLRESWVYPASEQWGEAGWTYTHLAEARCRYLTLGGKQGVSVVGRVEIADSDKHAPYAEAEAAAA